MKKHVLGIFLLLLNFTLHAQEQIGAEWGKSAGQRASNFGASNKMVVDAQGNQYILSSASSTRDYDPGPGVVNLSGGGLALLKLTPSGAFGWVKSIGSGASMYLGDMTIDPSGNLYLTGGFTGTGDFNPGPGVASLAAIGLTDASNGNAPPLNAYVVKLDSNGDYTWAKRFDFTQVTTANQNSMGGMAIAVDPSGGVITSGLFRGRGDFDPGTGTAYLTTLVGSGSQYSGYTTGQYISKLTSNGDYVWAKQITSLDANFTTYSGQRSMVVDNQGAVYLSTITGHTTGVNVDFDPGAGQANVNITGMTSALLKLDAAGNYSWVRSWAMPNFAFNGVKDLDRDASGNIFLSGQFSGTVDFDPGTGIQNLIAEGTSDIFVMKLNSSGNYLWANRIGSTQTGTIPAIYERADAISLDAAGNFYMTGRFRLTADFDPGPGTANLSVSGMQSVFAAKYDNDGNYIWAKVIGHSTMLSGYNEGMEIIPSGDNVYVLGASINATTAIYPSGCPEFETGVGLYVIKLTTKALPDGLAVNTSTVSPQTQNACVLGIPAIITGNAVGITSPEGFETKTFYQWQKSSSETGPWEDMPGEVFKDLQPLASQTTIYYRRQVKLRNSFCEIEVIGTSPVASVVISANVAPIANANGPQWFTCGANTVALTGTASGGTGAYTYQWFEGSTSTGIARTTATSSGAFTTAAVTSATTYTLQVKDAAGCVDIDQVTIVPAVANAGGPTKDFCSGSGGVQLGTAPVASPSVSYVWTRVSGSAIGTLTCTTCAQPIANPTAVTVYRLTVTVTQKSGATCTTTSDVTVTPVAGPNNNTTTFAGTDRTICKNESVTLGGTNDATFAYTWATGQYLSDAQVANPVFSAGTSSVSGGSINYTVTATKGECSFTDEVRVSVINSRITNQDETICGPVWSSHLDEDNAPGATYVWSMVSGNGTILQTRNGGKDAYLQSTSGVTRFRRTVTVNGKQCSADVLIQPCQGQTCNFDITTLSQQGCPKVFGDVVLRLGTTIGTAADYNFSWSPANLVDNPTASTVTITSTAQATITVTITNKYNAALTCTKSILINPPGWSLASFTPQDKYTCPNTPVQIGNAAVGGFTYAWSPATGLNSSTVANPTATVASSGQFNVTITEAASGCKITNSVQVNVSAPTANAGNDRAVCNGATVTLGTPAPQGTNYVYSWSPANTAWTNGTNASSAQPQVQFAFGSAQTFTLTVTDPLSGCTATDQVVLRNTVSAGEYAGAGITTCQGAPVQLGREAEPFAQYQWTPATGLSSATVANPTVLNPTATTTYTVRVSYPGCNTPLTDNVTVTVNQVPGLALIDKNQCSTTPVAIGYGSTGNPTAPAGATYQWSPATGLSSITAANPTANVTRETTYSVTVTLANGCKFTDQVVVKPAANAGAPVTICPGESTVIGTAAIAGATYSWTGANIIGATNIAQPTVRPTATTSYTVTVTQSGCTSTSTVIVTVNTPADFTIVGNSTICVGGNTTLGISGDSPANTTWQWSPVAGVANPTSTSTTITPAGTQTYRLTQTNLLTGCSNYKEVVVAVNPNTIVAALSDASVCASQPTALPLTVTSSGSYSYVWSPATGLSNAYVANPTVTTGSPRTYTVTVTDNTSKCQWTQSANVAISPVEACYPAVTLTGNVFHDTNGLTDVTVNHTTGTTVPTGLYVTLVNANNEPVKTVAVGSNGSYDFGVTPAGNYSVVLHQNAAGSTTASLPSGWSNTGEHLGSGTGSDAAINGILTGITVAGTNVTNANFGIQQPPVTASKTVSSQANPGGTSTVNLSSQFTFSDPDGTVASVTFTSFPTNVTTVTINGTTYVAPGQTPGAGQSVWPGTVTVPAASLSVLVDPTDGAVSVNVPFYVTDNAGAISNTSSVTAPFIIPAVTLSGNVFHDGNGLSDNTVNGTSTIPTGLYATLVDASNQPVATVAVNADGSYSFGDVEAGSYSVVLHQNAAGSTTASLPSGWSNTGEHLGSGTGSDAAINGILTGITVAGTNVTNANFGIQQPPVTTSKTVSSQANPGGTSTVNLSSQFTFSDPDGTVASVTFTSFPTNVTSVTINGTTYVAPGQTPGAGQSVWPGTVTVPATGLSVLVDPTDGDVSVNVPFYVTDNAGAISNTSSVTAPFVIPAVTLSGNVLHDANGLTDNTVNGTTTIPTGLYATLVDASNQPVATVAVNADGSYSFGDVEAGSYSVVLHQNAAGSTTADLPSGWLNTGEHLGTTAGSDGSANGTLTGITVAGTNVTNANFGIQQPPVTASKTGSDQPNPGGTTTSDITNLFNFDDPDGTVASVTFTSFPTNVTSVTINGTTYVAPGQTPGAGQSVWPGTVTVPATGLSVLVDPTDGDVSVNVPFYVTDNAGAISNTSSVTAPFTLAPVTLSGNVLHDANGLTDNTVNGTTTIPTGLYATLVDASNQPVATVAVNADGSYSFGDVEAGSYSVVLHQNAAGSTTASLPSGWSNTGEHLGSGTGSDAAINGILTGITVAGTNVTNANFGIQQPPVTTSKTGSDQPNPGGTTTSDVTNLFNFDDPDGTVASVTFTSFPTNVTSVTINGTTYVAPGQTPGAGQSVWPGTVTVPAASLSVLVDPTDGAVSVNVPFYVTDNAGAISNTSSVTAPFIIPAVTLSGNVLHDANGLTDNTVNGTTTIPTGLYATLVDASNQPVATVAVNADGSYSFGDVEAGSYSVVLHQNAAGSTTADLPSGWLNTGEHLGTTAGSDGSANGTLTGITVAGTNVTNANFGIQQPPVTTSKTVSSQANPGGTSTVNLSSQFTFSDPDGTVASVTFTSFPTNVTSVTINGTTYVAPGQTPGAGQSVWPGTVTVPATGLSVLVDPTDGDVSVNVPFYVTDNAGAISNTSSVTAPFIIPAVTLSGNVFHDGNGLSDNAVNSTSALPVPAGLYVTLVDASNQPVKTVAVGSNGSYDFGTVDAGTYSVVLHQNPAGSTTPSLPSSWVNTGEHLGTGVGSDGSVNGILKGISVSGASVTNANFGIQQPPVAEPKSYVIDLPQQNQKIKLDGSHASTGAGTSTPGQLTGTDEADGSLNGSTLDRTVIITQLPQHGVLWYDNQRVTAGQVISNYDASKLEFEFTGTGYTQVKFSYAYQDQAGSASTPVTYTLTWNGGALPVRLASFEAVASGQTTLLTWATASEQNSSHFEVQRKLDGSAEEWLTIGVVSAKGESTSRVNYRYTDTQPQDGMNLYRLKMTDKDGSFEYSRMRSVNFEVPFETSVSPNPATDKLQLKASNWKTVKAVRLTDLMGNTVYRSETGIEKSIDVRALPAGVYVLTITPNQGPAQSHRVILSK